MKNKLLFEKGTQSPPRRESSNENHISNKSNKAANILKRFMKGPYQPQHRDSIKMLSSSKKSLKDSSFTPNQSNRKPLESLNGQQEASRSANKKVSDPQGSNISPSIKAEVFQRTNEGSPPLTTERNRQHINRSNPRTPIPFSQEVTMFEASESNDSS